MEFTPDILRQIMPTLSKAKRELYAPMLNVSMAEFLINNERRVAAYLANLAHESMNLTRWVENLNYSAKRLTEVWPNRFPTIAAAAPFAHNPEALANKVYGGRMGNNKSGDGWKYRGRFPIQCTGKDLYRKASDELDIPELYTNPDSCLEDPMIGFRVSAWIFAREKGGNRLADSQQIKALTKAISGGYNGLAERIDLYHRGLRILPDDFRLTANASVPKEDASPDYMEEAEIEDEDQDEIDIYPNDKGITTSTLSSEQTAGTMPPAPAAEVKASEVSIWAKLSSVSIPAGLMTVLAGVGKFVQNIPPWAWVLIASIGIIVGYLIWREKDRQAHERTLKVMDAAASKTDNNLRLV